jgi:hypothetical protein
MMWFHGHHTNHRPTHGGKIGRKKDRQPGTAEDPERGIVLCWTNLLLIRLYGHD